MSAPITQDVLTVPRKLPAPGADGGRVNLVGLTREGFRAALLDAGIPIDVVGGTSIGSIVSGGAARDMTPAAIGALLREAVVDGKSPVDVTFPAISIASGARVTAQMRKAADGLDFEDGWRRAFWCWDA